MSKLLCIGHRGAMGHEPENTLRSFEKALSLDAPWVELDVQYADGELWVFHDETLDRTTDGTGYLLEKNAKYLRSLDAGKGEKIPVLSEVLELIDGQAGINVELKSPGTAEPVVKLLNKYIKQGRYQPEQFLISSFDHKELEKVRKLDGKLPIGILLYGIPLDLTSTISTLKATSVNPSAEFISQDLVDEAHTNGCKVFVYTVNEPEDITRMNKLGVDGVFTNFPERVF